ncbi:hypothetical protein GIX77_00670 [Lactobacillus reuteri]|uniref:Uncharacterized protein n=1 Tax=Limosilactobacillus reuteri TaxID=1598 RepID=A0A7X2G2G1_LIMRT|nr:hypothetical protein [Limosilactobacillus reuteri]MRH71160.1 hypothetical protein [Limosilactobacillus reuteri]MRH79305.1 hypothetical protein [Limosilactobacillus reuteri]
MTAKAVYSNDQESFAYLGAKLEPIDYEVGSGETIVVPLSNLTKRKFNVITQKWTGEKVIFSPTLEQKNINATVTTDYCFTNNGYATKSDKY